MTENDGDPPSGFFYAHEALGFVAYSNPAALDSPPPGQTEMRRKWGFEVQWNEGRNTPPLRQLRWVLVRVRWRLTRAGRHAGRRPCPLPPLGSMDRAEVRRLLRRQERPAFKLVADLRADMACARTAATDHEERLYAADRALCAALANGEVRVFGRRGNALYGTAYQGQHELVPSTDFLNELRGLMASVGWATVRTAPDIPMDAWLHWCPSRKDRDWGDLRFPKADILARFPHRAIRDSDSPASVSAPVIPIVKPVPPPATSKRNKGGRPEREDWISFDREMMRPLALDGGNLSRTAFRRAMKDWAAHNMQPVPDDRTIDRRIDTRTPSDVFVRNCSPRLEVALIRSVGCECCS